jgi:uncharacterized protein
MNGFLLGGMQMEESPLVSLFMLGIGLYLLAIWRGDYLKGLRGLGSEASVPGATAFQMRSCGYAAVGGMVLVFVFSALEWGTGTFHSQSTIRWFFLGSMLGACVIEELVFRGYLVIQTRGKACLVASCFVMSLFFALLHPYLWTHGVATPSGIEWITQLRPHWTLHSILTTSSIFAYSLWFYACRFSAWNPHRSLAPCFCAHAGVNLTVFVIKASMGFVV